MNWSNFTEFESWLFKEPEHSFGKCECGCGEATSRHKYTCLPRGIREGEYARFVRGHSSRKYSLPRAKKSTNGCWEATGHKDKDGYARFMVDGKPVVGTRHVWASLYGPISGRLVVCHRCDNPTCLNPAHLFLASTAENIADRNSKSRQAKGVTHWASKLSDDAVRDIRQMRNIGMRGTEIAKLYGVSPSTVYDVCHRGWRHIS